MLHYDETLLEGLPGPKERMAAYRQLLKLKPGSKKENYRSTPPTWPELWDMVESDIIWAQMCAGECIEDRHWVLDHCMSRTSDDQACESCLEDARRIEQHEEKQFDLWGALDDLKESWPPEPPGRYGSPSDEDNGIPF